MRKLGVINVFGVHYDVIELSQFAIDKIAEDSVMGYTDHDKLKIYVASKLAPERKRETIIHEVLHACLEEGTISYHIGVLCPEGANFLEEVTVRVLSHAILSVLPQIKGLK